MAESNGRVYDPAIARFLSPDPLLQAPNHWLSYNRYAYCMNNPMLYTDPSGMSWFSDLWDWAKGNPLINPIAGLDWLNENIAPSVNNFLDNNNISVNAGVGYSSGNGLYTYGGNQIFYHNQQANSTEAILGRTTVTFDNGIDQRGVNFVNNLGVAKENVNIASSGGADIMNYRYGNPEGDIITSTTAPLGAYSGISNMLYKDWNAMWARPLTGPKPPGYEWLSHLKNGRSLKFAKVAGFIGIGGDIVSIGGALTNLRHGVNWETGLDFTFAVIGAFPIVGDGISLSYMGTKDYIMNPQNYTNIPKPGDRSYISPVQMISDTTYKENIHPINNSLNNILKLNGYRYTWIESPLTPNDSIDIGVLAQEVEVLYPELVTTDSVGVKRVYYYKIIPILIEAIKEQQEVIKTQHTLLDDYKSKVDENENAIIRILKELKEDKRED